MKNYLLLILAILLLPFFFILGYGYHMYKELRYKHEFSMGDYTSNVSYQLDVTGCALVYNVRNHTLSATSQEKDHWWFTYAINILFWDKNHCYDQWVIEYKNREII